MTELTVRPAGASDQDTVVALWHASGLVVAHNDPVADFRLAAAGPSSDVLVGVDGTGSVVGSVMVGHDGHRGWLYYVAVDPARRRRGIGRATVAAAEAWLGERGIRKVQLMVRDTNRAVVRFYESLGYGDMPRILLGKSLLVD